MGNIDKSELIKLIREQQKEKKKEKFSGTFIDYLDLLIKKPESAKLSHKRLYDSIVDKGHKRMDFENSRFSTVFEEEPIEVYDYFSKEFFGTEKVIAKLMRFLKSAAMRGEESRQVLLLMGPVGAGKSALIEKVKAALESSENIYHLDGCPIREEPLHLLPRSLRDEFEKVLGIRIEGDLCPICRHRLMDEFGGNYEKFPVKENSFSVRGRRGIAVVPPMDANTQDTSVLIGTQDISKLDIYPEDDPRVLSLNGAFNAGNRGIVEFVEVFKNEIEFLHTIITATQEKAVPSPGSSSMIYFDGVILSHCNEAEWNKFKSEHTNEAILDRIMKIDVPYVLELDQEQKIYEKMINRSDYKDVHIAPHTIKIASMFSILSRLKSTNKCDPVTKMKIYNGEKVIEKGRVKKIDIRDLREEATNEGMSGISTRFITKAIDGALADSTNNFITPISVIKSLIDQVKEQIIVPDDKKRYLEILQKTIRDQYLEILENEIAKAFIAAYEEQAQSLFDTYLDNAEAYTTKSKVKDAITREDKKPDEEFMRSIEEQLGIGVAAIDGFRSDVTAFMFSRLRRGERISYHSYAPLKEAIENYLVQSVRDMSRIVTLSKTRDDNQRKKYNEMVEILISDYGYNADSAGEVIAYAANHLWRDS